jgi:uncharacterized cupin superfamily protein
MASEPIAQGDTAPKARSVSIGSRNSNPAEWTPFAWDDPVFGPQIKGEVAPIPFENTSGSLQLGLWRTGKGIAGCHEDGSCHVDYSAPLGDETMVILEGSATVTIAATGKQYRLEAGTIISHPKDVVLTWDIDAPFLKKFWILWDSPSPGVKEDDVYVGHISDNPDNWEPFAWDEPEHGPMVCGELFKLRARGSTGTLLCGLWRAGVGIAGCEPDGSTVIPYTSPLGDEIELLLEGQFQVVDESTGETHELKGGDILAIPCGTKLTWSSKAPFAKKFWLIANAEVSG